MVFSLSGINCIAFSENLILTAIDDLFKGKVENVALLH